MRVPRDRLVYLALCVLDDTARAASKEPVPPSDSLRLALAVLCALSDGPLFDWPDHRAIFVRFWCVVTGREVEGQTQVAYVRSTFATTCLHQIERQVRMSDAVARARSRRDTARATATARQFVHDEDEAKLDKRRYYFRPKPKE